MGREVVVGPPIEAGGMIEAMLVVSRLAEVLKVAARKHFESAKGGCTILYTF